MISKNINIYAFHIYIVVNLKSINELIWWVIFLENSNIFIAIFMQKLIDKKKWNEQLINDNTF